MLYNLVRPVCLKLHEKNLHSVHANLLSLMTYSFKSKTSTLKTPVRLSNLSFKNKIGLGLGFDKDGSLIDKFAKLGFGFIEIGPVCAQSEYKHSKFSQVSIFNRHAKVVHSPKMLPTSNVDQVIENIKCANYKGVIGVNLQKNQATPDEFLLHDLKHLMQKLYPYVNYFSIDINAHNFFQIMKLLPSIMSTRNFLKEKMQKHVAVAFRLSYTLNLQEVELLLEPFLQNKVDFVVAVTANGSDAENSASGETLTTQAHESLTFLFEKLQNKIPIISTGGVLSSKDAKNRLIKGCDLVQVYSGLIYQGPSIVQDIKDDAFI